LAISEYESVIQNEGEIVLPSGELAIHVINKEKSITNEKLTLDQIKNFLASFIEERPTAIAIDINNELGIYTKGNEELKIEENKEEIPQDDPQEEEKKAAPQTETEFIEQLKKTITTYEKLYILQKNQGKDTSHTQSLLHSLREQLRSYEYKDIKKNDIKFQGKYQYDSSDLGANKKSTAAEDKRSQALEEIFKFYSKQHANANGKKTFEMMEEEQNQLLLGYFLKFLKDFKISLEKKVIKIIKFNIII